MESLPYGVDVTVIVDTTPPVVKVVPLFQTLLHENKLYTSADGGRVHVQANDTSRTTSKCVQNDIAYDCTSGLFTTASSELDGMRTLLVDTTDAANLTTTTTFVYVVDRTPPSISLADIFYVSDIAVSGSSFDLNPQHLKATRSTDVGLTFEMDDSLSGVLSLRCQLDGVDIACGNDGSIGRKTKLDVVAKEEKEHVVVATVTDRAQLSTSLEWRWRHDKTAADVSILEGHPPSTVDQLMETEIQVVSTEDGCVFEWSLLPIDTSGSSCASPLPSWKRGPAIETTVFQKKLEVNSWGTYELAVRAIDSAGNVPSTYATRRVVFVPPDSLIPLKKPITTGIKKSSSSTNGDMKVNSILLEWEYNAFPTTQVEPTGFDVRIANDRQYITGKIFVALGSRTRSMVLPGNESLWNSELPTYLQVRTFYINPQTSSKSTSEWSAVSDPWLTADNCKNEEEYLNVNPLLLKDWQCIPCPEGAWCTGRTVWRDVVPLQGWWRVPWSTNGIDNGTVFVKCPYVNDCRGHKEEGEEEEEEEKEKDKEEEKEKEEEHLASADNRRNTTTTVEGCEVGTSGVVCSTCQLNYNRDGQRCIECSNADFVVRLSIVLFIVGLLISLIFTCRKRLKKKWKKYRMVYRDVLRILAINVTFAQINSSLPSVIEVEWPLNFVEFVDLFSFVNIDVMSLVGINCVGQFDFVLSFSLMSLLPVTIVIIAFVEYCVITRTLDGRLLRMTPEKKKEKEKEALHQLFNLADGDHSGVIDPSELDTILRHLGWNVSVRIAMNLAEQVGGTGDQRGAFLLHETQFVEAMASGKMMKLLQKMKISRRGKSMIVVDNGDGGGGGGGGGGGSNDKDATYTAGQTGAEKTNTIRVKTDTADAAPATAEQSSLGSRNKLVRWTLRQQQMSATLSGMTQLLLLTHTPVSRKVFQYFHYNNIEGREFVRADYSLIAWSFEYQAFLPIVLIVMITFTVALPATISFYLLRHRKRLYTTSVFQTIGWLYDAYVRGAEFWQVHDVILKMILTGMLIYIPNSTRAGTACILCTIACCNLNYFKPHKSKVLFWLTQISFLITTLKYICAMIINSTNGQSSSRRENEIGLDYVGVLLISLDIIFMTASLISIPMAFYLLQLKLKNIQLQLDQKKVGVVSKGNTKVTPTTTMTVLEKKEEEESKDLKSWGKYSES